MPMPAPASPSPSPTPMSTCTGASCRHPALRYPSSTARVSRPASSMYHSRAGRSARAYAPLAALPASRPCPCPCASSFTSS